MKCDLEKVKVKDSEAVKSEIRISQMKQEHQEQQTQLSSYKMQHDSLLLSKQSLEADYNNLKAQLANIDSNFE